MAAKDDRAANITPDSRVGELLERWPQLEDVLIELSPRYRALKNPVLRRTIAKVATLRQVSVVGGVSLATLIERLRAAAGLAPLAIPAAEAGAPGRRPPWAVEQAVTRRHDARAAIEAGEHPMPKVMADLAALGEGDVYELVTPFVPAPLVDLARGKGFESFSVSEGDAVVRTYFRRVG
ncbi:Domain of unknown function DUF1858 [Anaeromyxobacter dehalogenans 2CP-1]|uniref:DUF1858 domain-containing protein n=1 Tax=Anaeromyxobacter dehalogenans (strain ATCC BAA-258 / DSM 21875 / 2CP-1) TaxID=455488 RepID=B8JHK8_ANAD2|nr:DUF1858 domain-containing protein [Anaeromyxobacter dehalogenans]ACL66720.1 Domain of unknown function DUF1858 [Anaeromyxobacter dehalogenans 2CP-1]